MRRSLSPSILEACDGCPQRLVLFRLRFAFPWLTGSLGERIAAGAERELATKAG
ncbi:MAG TPA: hypothetical protein VGN76_01930 [Gemmatimonadales bacterium]|nr:hypothetical protein [Gemmatimonadales bacterium]